MRALVLGWLKSQVKEATTGIDATAGRKHFYGGKTREEWLAYKDELEIDINLLEESLREQGKTEFATQAQDVAEESE